jgi:GMP synthase (glutamine-hydrolysing)
MRILIFDGAPAAGQAGIVAAGGLSNQAMFEAAFAGASPTLETLTLNVADGERLPQGLAAGDFDGVVISGSPLNVYRREPAVDRQITLAREIFRAGVPIFGCCWGLQLVTVALGGEVRLNPRGREFGVARRIVLNEEGARHRLYAGKGRAFDALCSHEDEVATLPAGGRILAANAVSAVQAAEIVQGDSVFWGVQYHPEHTFRMSAALHERRSARAIADRIARTGDDVRSLAADWRALDLAPDRADLAWRYGLGADVLDPALRRRELANWIDALVRPRAAARRAAA